MANPESLISLDTGNNLAYQNDPAVAGAVIPRVAVVSSVAASTGSNANQTQLVDVNGNPLSTGMVPGSPSTYNPLIAGTYPEIVASWINQTFVASASTVFDCREFASLTLVTVVTAASGSTSLTPNFEYLEPVTNTWWRIFQGSAVSSVSASNADGSLTASPTSALYTAPISSGRLPFAQARLNWIIGGGGSPYIVITSYVYGS